MVGVVETSGVVLLDINMLNMYIYIPRCLPHFVT